MDGQYVYFVGIDWAVKAHEISVLTAQGRQAKRLSVAHNADAINKLMAELVDLSGGDVARVAVGIEIPRGALVEALAERGFHVYYLNPKQLDRFRDRHSVAGAKDDRLDAYVLSDALRTDLHLFHRVRIDDPVTIELREMSRVDDDLREELGRCTNRLREQLYRYFSQCLELCPAADQPWLWSLLTQAPTPAKARRLRATTIANLLRKHRVRSRSANEVVKVLRTRPLHVADGTTQAAVAHIKLLLPRLKMVHQQRKVCEQRMRQLLDELPSTSDDADETNEHRDVDIMLSFLGVGTRVCATMLAEASHSIATRNYHGLRAHCGVAPVTRQSGKSRQVRMRYGCNNRLRDAVFHWAMVSTQHDEFSRRQYAAHRRRGHSHGRALRGIGDRLLAVLLAALREGSLYDPSRRRRPQLESAPARS